MAKQKETLAPFRILDIRPLTRDTRLFVFSIPADIEFKFYPGDHVKIYPDPDDYLEWRPYTPTSVPGLTDHFDLIIKRYSDGMVSRFMHDRKPGDKIWMSGPHEGGHYIKGMATRLGLVAGGTGITPMVSIIRSVLLERNGVSVNLVFANKTIDAIILKDEFDSYAQKYPQFKHYYVLDTAPENWQMGTGRINSTILRENLPSPSSGTVIFVCGPPIMQIEILRKLVDLGHSKERIIFP